MEIQYLASRGNEEYTHDDKPLLGIDFGTTNSVVSSYIYAPSFKGPKVFVHQQNGEKLYPSVAYYDEIDNKLITGALAFRRRLLNPENVVTSIKRKLEERQISLGKRKFKPSDIVKKIIEGLLQSVKNEIPNAKPLYVTATVPYYFMQPQNLLIRTSAEKAITNIFGCNATLNIIPEPVAAAIYWLYNKSKFDRGNYITLVFDIGGGTLDISIIKSNIYPDKISCEVLANTGCSKLGGDDIDKLLYDHILEESGIDTEHFSERQRIVFRAGLMDAVTEAKYRLSFEKETGLVFTYPTDMGEKTIDVVIKRQDLYKLMTTGNNSFMS